MTNIDNTNAVLNVWYFERKSILKNNFYFTDDINVLILTWFASFLS